MIRCQITDGSAHLDETRWLARLNPQVDFIQIREGNLSIRDLSRLVRKASALTRVLVNDRADVAIACGAAGVHLRAHSLAPERIRSIAPKDFVITVACHSEQDVLNAEGADYAILAPIFRPLSKEDSREPLGLAELRRIAQVSKTPILALGGITTENTPLCLQAGASGVAGITLFRQP